LHLEAKAQTWLYQDARRRRDEAGARKARAALEELYWGKSAALTRLRAGEGLETLSAWDIDGALGVPMLALDLRLREAGKPGSAAPVLQVVEDYVAFCLDRAGQPKQGALQERALGQLPSILSMSQAKLNRDLPDDWLRLVEKLNGRLHPLLKQDRIAPATVAAFADFLLLESRHQHIANHPGRATALRLDAGRWLNDGLRSAKNGKRAPAELASLYASAAYFKLSADAPPAEYALELKALADLATPEAQGQARLCEGLALLRQGSPEKALEVIPRVSITDRQIGLPVLQAQIYLALGNIDRLLPTLRQLESAFNERDQLSLGDQLWLLDFSPRREMLVYLMAACHLDLARDKRSRFLQEYPDRTAPADLVQLHEREADNLARAFPTADPCRAWYLQDKARYYRGAGDLDRADQAIDELRHHPASRFALLSLELDTALSARSTKDLDTLETRLRSSLDINGADLSARLALVLLLATTDRLNAARSMLVHAPSAQPVAGDQLLPRQLDTLRVLYSEANRPELGGEMLALFASAEARYRHDPRIVFGIGQALTLKKDVAAPQVLRRAQALAHGPSILIPASARKRLAAEIDAALLPLK
jgi:hypothetical protein